MRIPKFTSFFSGILVALLLGLATPAEAQITLTTTSLPPATQNQAYSFTLTALGGTASYSYQLGGGILPNGVTLSPGGVISGTPTLAGSFNFTVTVRDSSNPQLVAQIPLNLLVNNNSNLRITTSSLPDGQVNLGYSVTLAATGGAGNYIWDLLPGSGSLPNGLFVISNGTIQGTPNVAGTSNFVLRVTDASGAVSVTNLSIRVNASGLAIQTTSLPNASVGVFYSQSITITGGTQPYTSSISSGSLPAGLSFNNGVISGTPGAVGSGTFTILVIDAANNQTQRTLTLNVVPPSFGFTTTALPTGQINVAYTASLSAVGGTAPYVFTITAGNLPNGISFTNGIFTGTPTNAGSFPLTIQVRDSASPNATVSANFNLVINATTLVLSSGVLPSAVLNTFYSTQVNATGGQAPYSFTIIGGATAPGLTLSPGGVLSGTPTATGSYQFTVRVQDSLGAFTQGLVTVVVNSSSLVLNSTALQTGQVNVPYSGTLTAVGGQGPYLFTITSGSLPQGLTLGANGLVSGTPTVAGSFQVTFRVQDSQGNVAQSSITIVINAFGLRITTLSVPSARQGQPYNVNIVAEGGATPYTFILTGGQLPAGLNLNFNGLISGTPTQVGNSSFTVRVIDSSGATNEVNLSIAVNASNISLTNPSLPAGQLNVPYSQTLVATGGMPVYTYTVTSGGFPAGINFANGVISGTPTASGTFRFSVRVSDFVAAVADFNLVLVIASSQLGINNPSLGNGTVGVPYTEILNAVGGTAPYTFTINGGALPNGLTLNANGTINGTPTLNGTFPFTVRVTDSLGVTATVNYSITVSATGLLTIVTSSMPDAQINTLYNVALSVSGGVIPYQFTIIGGALPPGLTLTSSGAVTGTPTTAGAYNFLVRVVDAFGNATQQSLTITVNATGVAITTTAIPNGQLGQFFTTQLTASGGQQPYSWTLLTGALPNGVNLQTNGILSGLPTTGGGFQVTIRVMDATGATAVRTFDFVIGSTVLNFLTTSVPQGFIGQPYNFQLQVGGGAAPYLFSVVNGTLPAGLTMTQLGQISGTPTATSFNSVTFRVTDATGATAQVTLNLAIGQSTVIISTTSLPSAAIGQNYNTALVATGGTQPYTWTVAGGALPAGLQLSPAGIIAGTATTAGIATFTVRVTDAAGATITQNFSINVLASSLLITTTSLPAGRVNQPYLQTIQTSGGVLPLRFEIISTIVAGQPPPGLSLSSNGTLQGTPQATGSYTFSIRVTDAQNLVAQATYTLVITAAAPSITTTTLASGTVGTAYSQAVSATGGTPPYTFALVSGSVPGLNFTPAGILSGTPNTPGSYTITVRVTDSVQATAEASFTVSIAAGVSPLSINAIAPPAGVLFFPYSLRFTASGGREPYSWSVASGPLPNGLRLDPNGGLTGQLLAPGTYRFSARVTDSLGASAETALAIVVANSVRLAPATVGTAYNATVPNPVTGRAPFSFALNPNALGTLPEGLSIAADGRVTGTPVNAGDYTLGLLVRDAGGIAQNVAITINVAAMSGLRIVTSSLPGGVTGVAYNQTLAAAGGTAPYNWVVSSGNLPNGLNLNPLNGQLSGTPTIQGSNFFVVRVQDATGATATTYYGLSVGAPGSPILSAVTSAASYGANGVAPGELLTIFGGTMGPQTLVSFSLENGAVPTQLSGTRVLFDGVPVPLIYTQAGQVSVIAPFALEGRPSTRIVVEYLGFQSTPFVLPVVAAKPGLFSFDGTGEGPGAILNQDGSVNTTSNRAGRESVVVLYLTGAGAMTPAGLEGRVAAGVSSLNLPVSVTVNGAPATVLYAGNAPGLVEGVVQMNIRLPLNTQPGQNPIRVQVGNNATTTNVTVWVQ